MKRALTALVILLTIGTASYGQGYDTSPRGQTGVLPFHSYSGGGVDRINLYDGNLTLDIPVASLPGRDLSTNLSMTYNSQKWQEFDFLGTTTGVYTGGWRLNNAVGQLPQFLEEQLTTCNYYYSQAYWRITAYWIDGLGTKRVFGPTVVLGGCTNSPDPGAALWLPSLDGDGSVLETGWGDPAYGRVYFENGTVIDFTGTPKIVTRNGNYLEFNTLGLPVQDTLGRTIGYWDDRGVENPYYKEHFIKDTSGTDRGIVYAYDTDSTGWDPYEHVSQVMEDHLVGLYYIGDTGHYLFEYNDVCAISGYGDQNMGFLTKMTLPAGGYIRYTYECSGSTWGGNDAVTGRYVSENGADEEAWTFSRSDFTCGTDTCRDVTETRPDGTVILHRFDASGREYETQWKEASGVLTLKTATAWTEDGILSNYQPVNPRTTAQTTTKDSLQKQTQITYDSHGRISERLDSDWYGVGGSVVPLAQTLYSYASDTYSWDTLGLRTSPSIIETKGWNGSSYETESKTQLFYDETGLASTESDVPQKGDPEGQSLYHRMNPTTIRKWRDTGNYIDQTMAYDDLGNVIATATPMSHTTTISYADNYTTTPSHPTRALPTAVSVAVDSNSAHNLTSSTVYDYNTSLPIVSIDPRGLETTYAYDAASRLISTTESTGLVTTHDLSALLTYGKITQSAALTGGVSSTTETYIDHLGRIIRAVQKDPAGDIATEQQYDENGRLDRVSAPYRSGSPVWTQASFDAADRTVAITNPDSTSVSIGYSGNAVTTTDEAGNQRRTKTNALGQLVEVDEPNPSLYTPLVTAYRYNMLGNLLHVDQSGQERTFAYDWLGRLTSETHPESGTTTFGYDNDSRLTSRTDARSVTASYSYDDAGRLLEASYSDSTPTVTRTYDGGSYTGLLTSMTDAVGTVTYTYATDSNLLASETRAFSGVSGSLVTSYGYDNGGRLTSVTYPSGRVVSRSYASGSGLAANRLGTLSESATSATLIGSVTDNAAGQVTARTIGSNVAETRSFNSRLQLTGIGATISGAAVLDLSYGFGALNNGRIASRTDGLQPEHSVSYSYDPLQRLASVTAGNDSWNVGWGFDAYGNRISQSATGVGSAIGNQTLGYTNNRNNAFSYDAAGHVTTANSVTYTYDGEGRMITAGSTVSYGYDGDGRRVKRTEGSETTYSIYGVTGLLSEFTTNSANGSSGSASTDRLKYRVPDPTGTGVITLNGSGVMVDNSRLFPYGERWNTASANSGEKFTRYQRDGTTGLDDAMARFYSSSYGTFMSPDPGHAGADPANPQSWNGYAYAGNDPINRTDPTGRCWAVDGQWVNDGDPGNCFNIDVHDVQTMVIDVTDDGLAQLEENLRRYQQNHRNDGANTVEAPDPPTDEPANNVQMRRNMACTADALLNFGASTLVPGYAATKAVLTAMDININPVQWVLGYRSIVNAGPTNPSIIAGASSMNWLYRQAAFDAAGGQARLDYLQALASRTLSGTANSVSYGSEIGVLGSLSRAASVTAKLTGVLSAVSAGYDMYNCWAGK